MSGAAQCTGVGRQPAPPLVQFFFFFFNDPATTEIYTLSLHDALPIYRDEEELVEEEEAIACSQARTPQAGRDGGHACNTESSTLAGCRAADRKSTRLNSSHPSRSRMPSSA